MAPMKFKSALLCLRHGDPAAKKLAGTLADFLAGKGCTTQIVTSFDAPPAQNFDLAIALGGDGTFLATARMIYGTKACIIGVNLGHLGFLAAIDAADALNGLEHILAGHGEKETRPFFVASALRGKKKLFENTPFLNDAVLQREAGDKMISYAVKIGPRLVTHTRADGVIIASPTGSTAYTLSTGGPIVHPEVDALVLSPICPHTLSFRPVVLPAAREVEIVLESPQAHLMLDGQNPHILKEGDRLLVEKAPQALTLLHANRQSFFDLLRQKLGWDLKI